ncbi:MAG: phenylalanine--tRNA ligase subunit beta [Anaerolineae bacterium]|nr:phenylalanine--tRNA ligase subunit beta [Thermoflexales bacterium]MDW8406435.1 phenylalanine--tRNA ligase subunit beta [Anaerolineae bacterium]
MLVPISWLKDYVEITLPIEELAERLTLAGLEVEHIEYIGLPGADLVWDRDKIFVGRLLKVERHPNADKLLLATVDYGAPQPIVVVTGAPNIQPGDTGQKVVLALKGARLYDGHKEGRVIMTLKEATLRGIKNDSMVCSEKELGLSDDHEGILLLPDDAPVGVPLADYLGDIVLSISILPSIARCASIIGVAREVAAITGQTVRYPSMEFTADGPPIEQLTALDIRDPRLNPRFTIGVIQGVTLKPSPFWMQRRLMLAGMRPINNIVDVSNYVMLELGQPTHAFDFDAIAADPAGRKTIVTRLAEPGEKLRTLDDVERALLPTDIVVADSTRALSIAGVMGGAESEVTATTRNILFEVAAWNWVNIRRTARHHNLHSEASYRFARGVHPELAMLAQKRGLSLLQQYAGGVIARGILDSYPAPVPPVVIDLAPAQVERALGVAVPKADIVRILRSLEFEIEETAPNAVLRVTAPPHRLDVEGVHDLIEEIGRIYGYDRVPATLINDAIPPAHGAPDLEFEERVRDLLVAAGLQEIVSYRLTTRETEARMVAPGASPDDRPSVTLQNPINPERVVMRRTLTANVIEALVSNLRHHARVAVFELGAVYLPSKEGVLPDELPRLAIGMSGARRTNDLPWQTAPRMLDFFDLKGIVEALVKGLHIDNARFEPVEHLTWRPGRTAAICIDDQRVGVFGELHPLVREAWDLPAGAPVLLADVDLVALRLAAERRAMQVVDVPRFPAIHEDLAVIVDESVSAETVERTIRAAGGHLLSDARLFDVFRGEQIGPGRKSLAYALTYRAPDRTLTDKEAEKVRNKIIRSLEGQLGGLVRR